MTPAPGPPAGARRERASGGGQGGPYRVPDVPEMPELDVPVRLTSADAVPPRYALPGDAGADLSAAEDVELAPFQRALVGTGVAVAIPEGYAGFVHPRSGLAHRVGLSLVNAPGTIDAGYRGEIKVNLINLDPTTPLTLRRGDRIAQLVVQPVVRARFLPVEELPGSARGHGGHGSTGGTRRPNQQKSKGGSDMPFGRRRNRIDRSLRERGVPPEPQHREREVDATSGPWDDADAPEDGLARIDLGSLRLPAMPGMDLRVELNAQQKVIAATLRAGESLLQVSVFAAPRAGGIWDGVREDLAKSASGQGGSLREVDGPFGPELAGTIVATAARQPGQTPPPQPVRRPARFLGVDGPRWFLRGMISGPRPPRAPRRPRRWRRRSAASSSSVAPSPCRSASSCR